MPLRPRRRHRRRRPPLTRPAFLAIVASTTLARRCCARQWRVDGFIVEGPTAGGHNAPPRGKMQLTDTGRAVYGARDDVDIEMPRPRPAVLAGRRLRLPEGVRRCRGRSGRPGRHRLRAAATNRASPDYRRCSPQVRDGDVRGQTDPLASPTGFPFKVAELPGRSRRTRLRARSRDLRPRLPARGLPPGRRQLGYRCAAEPVLAYVAKGGEVEDTAGPQVHLQCADGHGRPWAGARRQARRAGIVTSGDALVELGATSCRPTRRLLRRRRHPHPCWAHRRDGCTLAGARPP